MHYGTDYMLRNGVVPHVALLVSEHDLSGVFHALEPPVMSLRLDGVGFFVGGAAAFLHVVESRELKGYHRKVFETAERHGVGIHEYYRPQRWVPHCTIAQECTTNLGVPLPVEPMDVDVRSLILVEYPPTRIVAERGS